MPIAITDDQRRLAQAAREWSDAIRPAAVARDRDPDAWRGLWPQVRDMGLLDAALAAEHGARLTDQAVLLEAAPLAPGPVLPSATATLALAAAGHDDLLPADGAVALALHADGVEVAGEAGEVVLHGRLRPVVAAAAGLPILLAAGGTTYLIPADERVKVLDLESVDLAVTVGEVILSGAPAVPLDVDAGMVRDLAATLASAQAAGLARWCLDTAVAYAKVREQFDRPIGSFQSVKHLCAQMLCRVEAASAAAWDAAEAYGSDQHGLAAAVAAAVALDAAVDTAKDCIQVLGGIGFTWEHDAHLYLRRALALRQWLGGGAAWRRCVAERTLAGQRRTLRVDLGGAEQRRGEVRAVAERIAAQPEPQRREALVDTGYLVPHWPAPHGLDADPATQLLIDEELARAGVQRPDLVIAGWAVPTILHHGTPEQVARFVRPTLLGEIVWCQLFSEPDAGSDLAALRTRAERAPGGWRLSGQKVWTSLAQHAQWGICLARTDPSAPKHRGITYFLVDMASPGIEVRPLREITGAERFNEVFLDDVFVPDDLVVGAVGEGWPLARTTLAHERVAIGSGSSIGEDTERLVARVARTGLDDATAERLGALVADGLVGSLLDLRSTLRRLGGGPAGPEASVRKLLGVTHRQQLADLGLELAGPDGVTAGEDATAVLLVRALSIAGGTTQVLLSLVAERLLGLPRD